MTSIFADDQLAAFVAAAPPTLGELDVASMRAGIAERARTRTPGPGLSEVRDIAVGEVPVRLYVPADADLTMVVYLHGGGWTVGSLDSHDRMCRRLAHTSGVAVLAVDYRLAPENPWPASVDDAVSVLRWVACGPAELSMTPTAVAVAGDSAGGTLAALACLRLRDQDPVSLPDLQVLIYANTDLTGAQPSMTEKSTGWGLDADTVRFFKTQWVPDLGRWGDPDVSPLHASDLTGLPPTLIVSVEHDPIRDESEAYARRLQDAGVAVTTRREAGLIHNFMLLDEISPACSAAADHIAHDIDRHLSR